MEALCALALGLAVALAPWRAWRGELPPRMSQWLEQAGVTEIHRTLSIVLAVTLGFMALMMSLPWPLPLCALVLPVLPPLWVEGRRRARLEEAEGEVAFVSGAVALGVGAGRDLESSLAFAVTRGRGPLARELTEALSSLRLGQPRSQAFARASRLYPCAAEFLRALDLGETQGIPMGQTLERQADLWRRRRLDKAEARALRVPVLLMAPLALCIFPNVLVALLGPFLLDLSWTTP